MIDLTTELVKEQDKWHRRYNDAEIEIDRLKRENESYKLAIHRLIMERDCAIKDMKMFLQGKIGCEVCMHWKGDYSMPACHEFTKEVDCRWRGVRR